ncbi:MAG: hypothetical protein IT293_04435 [Deltaproteobacteria bacterium]|nr:hypothetical protein [Deltaproteobacteria bacterium]
MPSPRAVAMGVLCATLLVGAPAHAKRKPLISCPGGQFVFAEAPLDVGDGTVRRAWSGVLLADGMVSIPGVCPPVPADLRPGRLGMRLSAVWTDCDGIDGKVRLRGVTNASCSELNLRLTLPRTVENKPKGGFKVKGIAEACFVDPGTEPLEDGQQLYGSTTCTTATDELLQILGEICEQLQGEPCLSTSASCGKRAQEIFTGVSLFPSVTQPASWNHFGGRGEIMAQAGLCIAKDLANGPHTNVAGVDIGIGDVSISQKVAFRAFDVDQRMVSLYQNIDFCVPVFGCLAGVGQDIVVRLAASCPAHPVGRSCGSYPVKAAHALDVLANESARYLGLQAPVITVVTPYGPVNVRPQIQFWSKLGTVLSPFGTSAETRGPLDYRFHDPALDAFVDFSDWYGRIPGVLFSTQSWSLTSAIGWDSQVGLGSRDPRPWTSAWTPAGDPNAVRPDHDLGAARSNAEKEASVHLRAEAEISYSPTDILPSWLTSSGVNLSFKIWIKPKADAAVAGQLALYASEGFRYRVDNDLDLYTQLVLRDGASAAGSFLVDAGMDLVAYINMPTPFDDITLVDVHPDFSIPVTKGDDDSRVNGAWREARAGSASLPSSAPSFDGPIRTFHGDVDGPTFIAECLAEPVPEQPKEPPSFTPGDPNALNRDLLFPCDICVGVGTHDIDMCVPQPGHGLAECTQGPRCHPALVEAGICKDLSYHSTPQTALLYPANSNPLPPAKHWDCDGYHKSGCLDLCAFNTLTGALTVAKSAVDVVGPLCGIPIVK